MMKRRTRSNGPRKRVALRLIRTSGPALRTQIRERIDDETVEDYAQDLKRGAVFPPVDLVADPKGSYLIVDGWHRVLAHQQEKKPSIAANILELPDGMKTMEGALWYAVRANREHGLRPSRGDQRRRARAASLHRGMAVWSDRKIAREIGVGHQTVSRARNDLVRERELPHRLLGEYVDEYFPEVYIAAQDLKEAFADLDQLRDAWRYARQLTAEDRANWAFEGGQMIHQGIEPGYEYTFPIDDNPVKDGLPAKYRKDDLPPDHSTKLTDAELDHFAALQKKREFDAAAKRLKASGRKDLLAAIGVLKKYRSEPGLFADIQTLVLTGGPSGEHPHEDF